MANYGMHVDPYGSIWEPCGIHMGPYGAIWVPYETHMDPIRVPYASHMDTSWPIWDPYGTHTGPAWAHMDPYGSHMDAHGFLYVSIWGHMLAMWVDMLFLLVHVERSAWLLVIAYEQGGRVGLDGTPLGSGLTLDPTPRAHPTPPQEAALAGV